LQFILQDANPRKAVRVVSHGVPPEMFRSGAGAVVEGTYTAAPSRGGAPTAIFDATNLMVKHDGTYEAPKPGDTPVPDDFRPSS
jgi:cytochrome c-type biogenesis protein CcmE